MRAHGRTDPDIVTLFNGWIHLTTNPRGELTGGPLEGLFAAGTQLVTRYRLLLDGRPLRLSFAAQVSAGRWTGLFILPGSEETGKPREGELPRGSVDVSIERTIDRDWTERVTLRNYDASPRKIELTFERAQVRRLGAAGQRFVSLSGRTA